MKRLLPIALTLLTVAVAQPLQALAVDKMDASGMQDATKMNAPVVAPVTPITAPPSLKERFPDEMLKNEDVPKKSDAFMTKPNDGKGVSSGQTIEKPEPESVQQPEKPEHVVK